MIRSLPLRLYSGLGIAVLLVFLVGFITIDSLENQAKEADRVRHTHQAISYVRDIRFSIMQIRGGRRAYWVTDDPKDMDAYEKGITFIPNRIMDLRDFVKDNASQVANVMSLDSLTTDLLRYWRTEGVIYPNMSAESFKKIILEEEGRLNKIYQQIEK